MNGRAGQIIEQLIATVKIGLKREKLKMVSNSAKLVTALQKTVYSH